MEKESKTPKMEIPLPLFSQRDDRWKNKKLGTSASTIGGYGCLTTCLAMIAKYYGKDTDPDRLNQALIAIPNQGGYLNGNLYVWGALNKIYSDISETKQVKTPSAVSSTQFAAMAAEVNAGRPVIIEVDFLPETTTADMHFVVIVEMTQNADGTWNIKVADPWWGDVASLTRYGKPAVTIQRYVFTLGPIPTQPVNEPSEDQKRALAVITEGYNALPNDEKKPGNMEAYARAMVDEFKVFESIKYQADQFAAFIDKWFKEWALSEDPNGNKSHQIILEEEMGKLLEFEDKKNQYREAIEKAVGRTFDDDAALLKSLSALEDQMQGYKGDLEVCLRKLTNTKVIKAFTLGKYIIKILKNPDADKPKA